MSYETHILCLIGYQAVPKSLTHRFLMEGPWPSQVPWLASLLLLHLMAVPLLPPVPTPVWEKKGVVYYCSTHPSSSASFSLKSDWKIDWPQSSSLRKLLKDYYVRPPLTIVAVWKKEKTHTLALGKLKVCKNDTPFLVFWIWWVGLVALNTIAPFNLNGREIFRW